MPEEKRLWVDCLDIFLTSKLHFSDSKVSFFCKKKYKFLPFTGAIIRTIDDGQTIAMIVTAA
ncbi:MAG: hypothetical protein K5639_05965 [Eubacterium sp.]|nr:hypothetical protein [Eubacterium sp.]